MPANRVSLSFSVERRRTRIDFVFALMAKQTATNERLILPPLQPENNRERRDELWRHTCFEMFLGKPNEPGYAEVNLAPNGNWNMYGFTDYRAGMHPLQDVIAPALSFDSSPENISLQWRGTIDAAGSGSMLGELLKTPVLVMDATAVLEYESGTREYWALAHAGDKPDFHLRESFCLVLDSSGAAPP